MAMTDAHTHAQTHTLNDDSHDQIMHGPAGFD